MKNKEASCRINTFWNDLRVKNGIKMEDLSSYLGVNVSSVSKYITGKTQMPTNVIIKLAEFFDIPIEEANKEAARLKTIHFSSDGRKRRSINKVEGEADNKETKEEDSSTSSDDMIELILDAVYGKVTREEYKKIEDYLRR